MYPVLHLISEFFGEKPREIRLNISIPNFSALVVAPGLTYGEGEDALFYWFQKAWECERLLPILGRGGNAVPLLNVLDLAECDNIFVTFYHIIQWQYISFVLFLFQNCLQFNNGLSKKALYFGRRTKYNKTERGKIIEKWSTFFYNLTFCNR